MIDFLVDEKKCTRCRNCVLDCPARIIESENHSLPFVRPENESNCIHCQHCLAICPTAAISILGKKPGHSLPLTSGALPNLDAMTLLMRGRRSVRRYRDENVDRALLHNLLATLAHGPTGVNRRALTFTLIDDKAVMQKLREQTLARLAEAVAANRIPPAFTYLHMAVPAYREHKMDILFRGAPHLLIVSAAPDDVCPRENVALTLAFFDLLAQAAGLGTVWCGMLSMVLETLPELKQTLGLPAGHHYYSMLFGLPAVQYARTVQREDTARIHRVAF